MARNPKSAWRSVATTTTGRGGSGMRFSLRRRPWGSPDMTDQQPFDRDATAEAAPPLEPWEVFRQEKEGDAMRHGGSVMAPDAVLAVHYAREMYSRRQESVRLWVARRRDLHDLDAPPPLHATQ